MSYECTRHQYTGACFVVMALAIQLSFSLFLAFHDKSDSIIEQTMPGYLDTGMANDTMMRKDRNKHFTKIVAICDSLYFEFAPYWYRQLTSLLGYENVVVVAIDKEAAEYFQLHDISYETLDETMTDCGKKFRALLTQQPLSQDALKIRQHRRRAIFGMRWLYVLNQLKSGHHVLLTDIDNIFVHNLPMHVMENSDYDVYHAYATVHPSDVYEKLGFTVCGGMAWFRASPASIQFVETVLHECGWIPGNHNNGSNKDKKMRQRQQCPLCDDQKIVNHILAGFSKNNINITWNIPWNDGAMDRHVTGQSKVTGHTFTIWSKDIAYRGPIPGRGNRSQCPGQRPQLKQQAKLDDHGWEHQNWVAMPTKSVDEQLHGLDSRKSRLRAWYERCEPEKLVDFDADPTTAHFTLHVSS